jgi:hypothetical protein
VDVFLQSLLLAGIGVCVWLAFHPSSREDYDDIETPRRAPRPSVVGAREIPRRPANPYRRGIGDGRLIGQHRADHDDAEEAGRRPVPPGDPSRSDTIP